MSSQLQVSGEAKIRDIQGPVVANSGVITALDGAASQYVRGDGTLADFPTSSGGGSSVSYYLNSSVSQGTIGGVAYRELSKDPIIGAGTDIPISANGYVASYITDANDPDVVIVPGGNFNCEFYFSVSNDTGNPTTYAELYKYDGTTFTLLGTSAGVPESINQGTVIAPYYFAIPVATAALSVTDRLAIRIYVNVDGRTVTLHTENGHLCQVVTTLSKGMVSLNNLTDQSQFITTGTTGTDFNIVSSGDTHTFNLPIASATNTGKLSSTDWSVFNNKQAALTFTAPLVNTSNTISIPAATSLVDGYLDNLDWVNFNTAYNNMIVSAAVTGTTTKTLTLNQQDGGTVTASWTDDNTDAVTSVFGRTGAVVATSGDYTTTQVTEGTNLYFTNARAQSAITGGASTITTSNLDTSKALSSNSSGKVVTSITTATELSYLSGVSSNVQTQLDGKAATFTLGSVSSSPTSVLVITGSGAPVNGSLTFTINQSSSSQNGYLSSTDWSTFNNKQGAITLTTTGTSGAATLVGNTLNIPNYTPDLSGYVTIGTTQTITGTKTFSGANRQESGILLKNGVLTGLAGYTSLAGATNGFDVQLSGSSSIQTLIFQSAAAYSYTFPATSGTLALTSQLTSGTVTSVGLSSATSGVTIGSSPITTSGTITLAIATASGSQNGLLSSTDWTTFNNKQSALTNPVTGTGTTNYLPKFTGASTIGNSLVYDDGTNVGIGTTSLVRKLTVSGSGVFTDGTNDVTIWNDGSIGTNGNLALKFNTNGTLKATLTASGNLGLGVTPSAWSGFTALQIQNSSLSTTGSDVFLNANCFFNGSNWRYIASAAASQYYQDAGSSIWRIAPSGTAGNAISFTQAMTLDASGRLGIGTPSPTDLLTLQRNDGRLRFNTTAGTRVMLLGDDFGSGGFMQIYDASGNVKVNFGAGLNYFNGGNLLVGTTTDAGYKLDVNGTGRFSGELIGANNIVSSNGGTLTYFQINNTSAGGKLWTIAGAGASNVHGIAAGTFYLRNSSDGSNPLLIASTGAATFTASASAPQFYISRSEQTNQGFSIQAGGGETTFNSYEGTNSVFGEYVFKSTKGSTTVERLRINGTGAATFSSSVTATDQIKVSGGGAYLSIYDTQASSKNWAIRAGHDAVGDLAIRQSNSTGGDPVGAGTTRLYINNGGNVGIGTSSPSQKLEVAGVIRGEAVNVYGSTDPASTSPYLYSPSLGALGFGANGSERMRITSGGNVLIGTTTDAGQKLQVNGITKTNAISLGATTFSSSTTLTDAFFFWEFTGGAGVTLTMYSSSSNNNTHFIKNSSGVSLTINAHSGGVIMGLSSGTGSASITLGAYKTVQLISRGGGAWYIMYQTT